MKIKFERHYLGFVLCILFMFIGSFNKICTLISLLFVIIVAIWMGLYYSKYPKYECCIGIINLLIFQNFSLGVGAHLFSNMHSSLKYITQIPFLTVSIIWLFFEIYLIKNKKLLSNKEHKIFWILIFMIMLSLIIGRGSFQSILINFRNLTVFFMAYSIGYECLKSEREFDVYQQKTIIISLFVLLVGIVLLILGYNGYKIIGIKEVYFAKGSPLVSEALDGRFYTTLISKKYYRMGSLYYEPVNLAYFFAAVFLSNWFRLKNKIDKISLLLVLIGLILTFGKGGYLLVIATFLCIYTQKIFCVFRKKFSKKNIIRIVILFVLTVLIVFCIYYYKTVGAAVSPHFWGVIQTWQSILKRPFGYGLGTGGNMAQIFNTIKNTSWLSSGGETALMSFMYQIGIQGIIVFIWCFTNLSVSGTKIKNTKYDIYIYIPIIIIGISLLQDNTFTPQCIIPFMFLQGGAKKVTEKSF